MGVFDWLGPLNAGRARRGWDALPAERKSAPSTFVPLDAAGTVLNVNRFVQVTPSWADHVAAENSAVYACLQAIGTSIAEPEAKAYRLVDGERVEIANDDATGLLRAPNPHMTLDTLLWYLAVCLKVDGNAYWRKLRAGDPLTGNVVELWPISPSKIEVVTRPGSTDFVSFYRYMPGNGRAEELDPSNVVHFRTGLDDNDHRLGCAPLKRLLREISSDAQATRYADRLLANLAIAGLALTFDKDAPPISQEYADELKAKIASSYGGDNVGGVAVISPGGTLSQLGFSPEQMDLQVLHRVPEERISAVIGVPAIVAGLGAGLDRATYANFKEAREAFTEQTLVPLWRAIAATITLQLVPDFTSDRSVLVDFDTSSVRALADDQNANAERLKTLVGAGILTEDEARAELGYGPKTKTDVETPPSPAATTEDDASAVPAELRSARRIRAVRRRRKAIDDIPDELGSIRSDALPAWERALVTFLEDQLARVTRRLERGAQHAELLVPDGEAVLLGETLAPYQRTLLRDVADMVAVELGIAFDVDDTATRAYLEAAGGNISGITETTRSAVQAALIDGQAAGEGIEQLARRLADLPAFDRPRGRVVARTELGHAQNLSALTAYAASSVVVGIRVLDGDYDAACQAIDGRTFALDQAPATLEHPNCTRAFAPLTDADDLTGAA